MNDLEIIDAMMYKLQNKRHEILRKQERKAYEFLYALMIKILWNAGERKLVIDHLAKTYKVDKKVVLRMVKKAGLKIVS